MSKVQNSPKSGGSTPKLSDTQLILLSAAAQREDHCLVATRKLKGGAAQKVAGKLIAAGLVREINAKVGMPVWRRDSEAALSYSLKLTAEGLQAIAVDETSVEDDQQRPRSATRERGPNLKPSEVTTGRRAGAQGSNEGGVSNSGTAANAAGKAPPRLGSKLADVIQLLWREKGATIEELVAATGWLPHTTRAALTGLRKRGYEVPCDRSNGLS
jgi:hypothetical protein